MKQLSFLIIFCLATTLYARPQENLTYTDEVRVNRKTGHVLTSYPMPVQLREKTVRLEINDSTTLILCQEQAHALWFVFLDGHLYSRNLKEQRKRYGNQWPYNLVSEEGIILRCKIACTSSKTKKETTFGYHVLIDVDRKAIGSGYYYEGNLKYRIILPSYENGQNKQEEIVLSFRKNVKYFLRTLERYLRYMESYS